MALLDVTGDAEEWPARREQAPIAFPVFSPVTEGLGRALFT